MHDVTASLELIAPLRDLAEGTDELIVCLTSATDGTLLWASPRGLKHILGSAPEDVVGQPGLSMLAGVRQTDKFEDDLAIVRGGSTTAARYEALHKDGRRVPVQVTGWRVSDDVAVGLAVRTI